MKKPKIVKLVHAHDLMYFDFPCHHYELQKDMREMSCLASCIADMLGNSNGNLDAISIAELMEMAASFNKILALADALINPGLYNIANLPPIGEE